jgi:hypothetical protein
MQGSIFKCLADILKHHSIPPLLVGGYAAVANKIQRMTFDIDLMMTAEDYWKIEADLTQAGYEVKKRQDAFIQLKSGKPGMRDLDFLIGDKGTIGKLMAQGKEISLGDETFVVPSPLHLIAMKLHSISGNPKREVKDLPDVIQLMAANGINPQSQDVRAMFTRYKVTHLYDRVVKSVRTDHGRA